MYYVLTIMEGIEIGKKINNSWCNGITFENTSKINLIKN